MTGIRETRNGDDGYEFLIKNIYLGKFMSDFVRTIKRKIKNRHLYGFNDWLKKIAPHYHADSEGNIVKRDMPPNLLESLGEKHKPSKRNHDYLYWYDLHFAPHRKTAKKVVEIGVQTDRSILMWEEYFENAEIIGVDIAEYCKEFEGGRKKIIIGDQCDRVFLKKLAQEINGADIIIDDGLHSDDAITRSFEYLFPALKNGGVYVIEDIIRKQELIKTLSDLSAYINYWPPGHSPSEWAWMPQFEKLPWVGQNVIGIAIYRYLAFITRGNNPRFNPFLLMQDEFWQRKNELRTQINAVIDAMVAEGIEPQTVEISKRLGNRGLATIREVLGERGFKAD